MERNRNVSNVSLKKKDQKKRTSKYYLRSSIIQKSWTCKKNIKRTLVTFRQKKNKASKLSTFKVLSSPSKPIQKSTEPKKNKNET